MTLPTGSADELGVEALDEGEKKALDWLHSNIQVIPLDNYIHKAVANQNMTELEGFKSLVVCNKSARTI